MPGRAHAPSIDSISLLLVTSDFKTSKSCGDIPARWPIGSRSGHTPPSGPRSCLTGHFRLTAACGEYRERFGAWPTEGEIDQGEFDWLKRAFTPEDFDKLQQRLPLRAVEEDLALRVTGSEGTIAYDGSDGWNLADEARRWLGVEPTQHPEDDT